MNEFELSVPDLYWTVSQEVLMTFEIFKIKTNEAYFETFHLRCPN